METVQGGVPPYGVKETLVVNGKMVKRSLVTYRETVVPPVGLALYCIALMLRALWRMERKNDAQRINHET